MNNYSLFSYFSYFCKNLNIPTLLTIGRFILIPFICISIVNHYWIKALLLFFIAAITDVLDGALARWTNSETTLGAYLDPLADKCLIICSFLSLSFTNGIGFEIPYWFTISLLIKELFLVGMGGYFSVFKKSIKIKPTLLGKGANFIQSTSIIILFLAGLLGMNINHFLNWILFFILVISFGALLHYLWIGYKELKHEH